ncbi:MAG: hypothetical protein HXY25_01285 [Alphaproteobacteria bacterium]|nr:hypothetical protein [Alphaproteobacteria bacterium]
MTRWGHEKAVRALGAGLLWAAVAGCAGIHGSYESQRARYELPAPAPDRVTVCHGYGCVFRAEVSLSPEDRAEIAALFTPAPADAAAERAAITRAIARFEETIGPRSGTANDAPGTFGSLGMRGQQDCVDEMLNTAAYLTLLEEWGLLSFHTPYRRVTATFFEQGFWPHTAATLRERASGAEYVVDSWVYANGAPPIIAPIDAWRDNSYRTLATR